MGNDRMILLINPGHDDAHYTHQSHHAVHRDPPPLGILKIGTFLQKNGYSVRILDTHVDADWRAHLMSYLAQGPLWIGLSVIIGKFMKNAAEITNIVRTFDPGIPVVWGGVMPTVLPDEIRKTYKPDAIITGAGELKALMYSDGRDDFENVPPLALNDLPIPDWCLFGDHFNLEQVPYYHMIMTSVGCPFQCTFCYRHTYGPSQTWMMRDAQLVCDEMDWLYAETGSRVFTIGDDNFLVNRKRAAEILQHCHRRGYYIEECIGHINNIDVELIDAMAGIVQTFIFSVESAVPRYQTLLKKQVNLESVPTKVRWLNERGIACTTSFIVGLPGESSADLAVNWTYMERLKEVTPWIRGNVYLWFPLPKTELTDWTETEYNVNLHFPVREYEDANFWVKSKDDPNGLHFRPWMTPEYFDTVTDWCLEFNERFHFPGKKGPYVRDRLLAGETIDLEHDLVGI